MRTLGQLYYVKTICPEYLKVNTFNIESVRETTLEFALSKYARDDLQNLLSAEILRRKSEIDATGPVSWCAYQRDVLRARGLLWLFD